MINPSKLNNIFKEKWSKHSRAAQLRKYERNKAHYDRINPYRDKSYDFSDAQSYRDDKGGLVGSKEGKWDNTQPEHINMVDSSAIDNVFYDPQSKDLNVKFRNGKKTYTFPGVPEEVVEGWRGSPSKGRYYHSNIKQYSINN